MNLNVYQIFFFKALGVFFERTNETIKCEMFHHCKIPCTNRPNCEPSKECKIEWKIGMGTGNPVRTSKNIAIDGRGMNLFFVKIKLFVFLKISIYYVYIITLKPLFKVNVFHLLLHLTCTFD